MEREYDRAAEDLGNAVALEHVNVCVPDQRLANVFYVSGLGLTRDPYRQTGIDNMWINVGRSQFHLPTNPAQVLRGHVGLVLPDREALLQRLAAVKALLEGTEFAVIEEDAFVEVTSPWGNRFRCFEPDPTFGAITLGMPYIEFDVPLETAAAIARFYREILGMSVEVGDDLNSCVARCSVGHHQDFVFRETDRLLPAYDGHHVQIYLADFSGPHRRLKGYDLIIQESNQWQYRFKDLVDLDSGKAVFTLEHEIRSMTHPLYMRPLINRDPDENDRNFAAGHENQRWTASIGSN